METILHYIGFYHKCDFRPNQIQVCIDCADALYYNNLEDAKKRWQQYVFKEGKVYMKIKPTEKYYAVKTCGYGKNGYSILHKNVVPIQALSNNREFKCLDCGQSFIESITSPYFQPYKDGIIHDFNEYTECTTNK